MYLWGVIQLATHKFHKKIIMLFILQLMVENLKILRSELRGEKRNSLKERGEIK